MRPSLLFSVSFLSPCFFLYLLGSFEVTVTSVSLPPFVSRRGLSNTNQRLSHPTSLPRSLVLCLRKVVRYLKLTVESVVASTLGLLQGAYIASALRKIIQPGMRQRACKDF